MDKEVRVERSHRSLTQRRLGDTPRVIITRLHNEGDAMDIMRKAQDRAGQLKFKGSPIAIFLDYTANVTKARAAFTEVRRMLRGRQGIHYGLLFPAKFRISHNNVEKEFVDATKALDYVKKNVIPANEMEHQSKLINVQTPRISIRGGDTPLVTCCRWERKNCEGGMCVAGAVQDQI